MSCQARVDVPCDALSLVVPQRCWFDALVGPGGQAQRRLLKGSGCHALSLRSDTPEPDLRIASKLYVDVKAPNKEALNEGLRRVRLAIEDVLSEYGASHGGRSPPTPPLLAPQVEAPVVPLTAPSAPPPAWGAAPPPPPAAAATDEGEQACDLCMADVVANVRLEPCGHYACVACVAGLRRRALFVSTAGVPCPFCRTVVVRYDAPPGVDVGVQPAAAPETSLALRATLPPLEIRRPPPAAVSKVSREAPLHPKYKTVLCERWLESGACEFGARCCFAHGEAELRVPVPAPVPFRDLPRVDSSSAGLADSAASWRAPASTAVTSVAAVSQPRAERGNAAASPPVVAVSDAVQGSSPCAAPSEPLPAPVAAAHFAAAPAVPSWLALAVGAQQPSGSSADAAFPVAAPAPASITHEAALAGTPWELILQLEGNGF